MKTVRQANLCIADFTFNIFTDDADVSIHFDKGYDDFFIKNCGACDVSVKVHANIPMELLDIPPIYTSSDGQHPSWSIHKYHRNHFIIANRQGENNSGPHYIAFFNDKGNRWDIYTRPVANQNGVDIVEPFANPIGTLLLYYLAINNDGLLINASGVFDGKKGYLFCGPAGSGKRTMARIWKQSGAYIIDNSLILIRNYNGKINMYNTPMVYNDHPKKAVIDEIFLIKQTKINYKRKLNGNTASNRFIDNCIHLNYNKKLNDRLNLVVSEIQRNVPFSDLGFLAESSIIDVIKGNETPDWQ